VIVILIMKRVTTDTVAFISPSAYNYREKMTKEASIVEASFFVK